MELVSEVERLLTLSHSPIPTRQTALPYDLLLQIALHLDFSSARNFIQAGKAFVSPGEKALWRDLDLSCNFSDPRWVSRAGAAATRRRLKVVLEEGAKRDWRIVKSLSVSPRRGLGIPIITLLENVSPTLESLHIKSYLEEWIIPSDSIDHLCARLSNEMMECGSHLVFQNLTTVRLEMHSFRNIDMIPFLVESAPCLSSLAFAVTEFATKGTSDCFQWWKSKAKLGLTSLRELSVSLVNQLHRSSGTPSPAIKAIIDLINRSHLLQQLGINLYPYLFSAFQMDLLSSSIHPHKEIQQLSWGGHEIELRDRVSGIHTTKMVNLKSLQLICHDYAIPKYITWPANPFLETIYFDCSRRHDRFLSGRTLDFIPHTPDVLSFESVYDLHHYCFRFNPSLRHIHLFCKNGNASSHIPDFDHTAAPIQYTAIIRSWKNGSDELIHLRLLVQDAELPKSPNSLMKITKRMVYTHGDRRIARTFGITKMSKPYYVDLTFFQEQTPPMEIIEQMRVVEGVADDDGWDKRGVQVSDRGWRVLTDWRARVDVENEAEFIFGADLTYLLGHEVYE